MALASLIRPVTPPSRPWTATRVLGHVLMAVWILSGIATVYYLVNASGLDFLGRYGEKLLSGFQVTIQLVGLSVLLGAALSIPIAFARMSRNWIIGGIAYAYVYFFRGTPLIAQAFLFYYGAGNFNQELKAIGAWWIFRDAFTCAVFVFALNTAAYQAEILRGAIQNVPRGQIEGAKALGLPRHAIFLRVVMPQALIIALRPYGNEIILMIKGSAIASIITVYDLMGETRRAFSRSFDFQAYVWAALLYLVLVETLGRIWTRLERRLTRHLDRPTQARSEAVETSAGRPDATD
ncbi:ABC transporter permease [Amorphus orientalis]|uniref:Polar amino acid transport system permease protein n=1 Tax=Amorphus orientalis TaxID=649198 RepID=A0AAE4ASG5_9HYPH|nr:ABC transporter permease [Amorphus orientalis]MDQ0316241.1 polar amino acid transport system permease protein [Amorphus orientalis]